MKLFNFFKKKQEVLLNSNEYAILSERINKLRVELLRIDTDVLIMQGRVKTLSTRYTKSLKLSEDDEEKPKDIYKGVLLPE